MAYPAEIDDRLGPEAAGRMAVGEQLLFATHASRPAFGFGGPSFLFVLTFFAFATLWLGLHIGAAALIAVLPSSLGLVLNRLSAMRAPADSLLRRIPFGPVALIGTSRRILIFSLTDSGHGLRSLIAELHPGDCVLTHEVDAVRLTQVNEPDVALEILSRPAAQRLPGASGEWAQPSGPEAMQSGPEAMQSGPEAMQSGPEAMQSGPEAVQSETVQAESVRKAAIA